MAISIIKKEKNLHREITNIYSCYENGIYSIKQIIQSDNLIQVNTKNEGDDTSEFSFREIIKYARDSYCLESYKSYRKHLLTESFEYLVGKCFIPNIYAGQYKGYSAENAYSLLQAILLLPKIAKNDCRILLYDYKHFVFSTLIFKKINTDSLDNQKALEYKVVSPISGIAEYDQNEELLSFQSRSFWLHRVDNT